MPSTQPNVLRLRPLSGSEADIQVIHVELEREPPEPATFAMPDLALTADQTGAQLLSDALRLSLRRGAGPFRSAAQVGFEPRAYQLVPLLMALRQPVVRLLIADDVGIGKTVEAGLVVRELLDRGEIDRFAVLCPPHLVEQWVAELRDKFDIDAVAVTSASAARLERKLQVSQSVFDAHPFTVVSLDYIKADRRRERFAATCPPTVIVDEAHSCVGTARGRQQRFQLLERIAGDQSRNLLLLTATPHSGLDDAFDRLLGLLKPEFSGASLETDAGRAALARHFVQRRRIDVAGTDWGETRVFARHETRDVDYHLTIEHVRFHDAVLDWCLGSIDAIGADDRRRHLAFWDTLALMRCVGSSPAAALSALRNRAVAADPQAVAQAVFDEDDEDADAVDLEPTPPRADDPALRALVENAERLVTKPDPKLDKLVTLLTPLVGEGANPVVFCRYIGTADYVADGLRAAFPGIGIEAVTGLLTASERRARVETMGEYERRLLVATDCLSEGINLQDLFDCVVHYDMSWNPTRHQQREGRVDRFGQRSEVVRSLLMFSPDSAIDGAVLEVILRKASAIRARTGVSVSLPDDRGPIMGALMKAVLLRKEGRRDARQGQLSFDLTQGLDRDAKAVEERWRDVEEGEKRSRARFAQNALKPADVAPEWERWRSLVGTPAEVRRFVETAMIYLGDALRPGQKGGWIADISSLPEGVSERLKARGVPAEARIAFDDAAPPGFMAVTRSHPIPSTLADGLIAGALEPETAGRLAIGRCGTWRTAAVDRLTAVLLLRLRHKLTTVGREDRVMLAEEAVAVAFRPGMPPLIGEEAAVLLTAPAGGEIVGPARKSMLDRAFTQAATALDGPVAEIARGRAEALAADHARVRAASTTRTATLGRTSVEAVLPIDVIGLYVLAPTEI